MYSNAKAQHIAAGLLSLAPGQRLSKLALIKLMYIADRMSVQRHGYTMSEDQHFSLPHGPILSEALDAINHVGTLSDTWGPLIGRNGDELLLNEPVSLDDLDQISDAEAEIISEAAEKYRGQTGSQLRNLSHEFPEWEDPGSSSLPISFIDIAIAVGLSREEAQELNEQNEIKQQLDRILVAG